MALRQCFSGLDRWQQNRRGAVAVTFALMVVPIFLTIGGAIDYSRAVHFRSELQGGVDAAAIAGVSAYVSAASSGIGSTVATNFMTNSTALLPQNAGITYTVTPSTLTSGATLKGYLMTVTATGKMNTTFLGLLQPSITVAVSATAENPLVNANPTAAGTAGAFSASAADHNTISWYVVPPDGSLPTATELNVMWSNQGGPFPTTASFQVAASAKIGFALTNVTGAGYTNQYGSKSGTSHTFYSQLNPPTNSSAGYNSINNPKNVHGVDGPTGNNCTLQVLTVPTSGVMPTPQSGKCFPSTQPMTNAQPSCSQLSGAKIAFFWNDMGGTSDDEDYNDAQYTFSCSSSSGSSGSGSGGPTSVVLIQ